MNIAYSMTRNLYPYFMPSLTSLLEHNSPRKVYIFAEDDELPYELPKCCEVINVSGQTYFPDDNANAKSVFTYMAMIRVAYAELLPRVSKLIQLDVDTIICDSLKPLWDIDIKGKWLAACPEYQGSYNPWMKDKYYNIGVCVWNLTQVRKDKIIPDLVKMLNTTKLWCVEQDALNYYAVPDKIVDFPVRYNESFCCGYTSDPAVVHYAGRPDWYENRAMFRWEYLAKYLR